MKPVLNKIIHTDQKGFVAGRNISENNRMIDDIIEFVDNEDEEGVIIFVYQQKAFDRMECLYCIPIYLIKFIYNPV
jgi:hypothetical protein